MPIGRLCADYDDVIFTVKVTSSLGPHFVNPKQGVTMNKQKIKSQAQALYYAIRECGATHNVALLAVIEYIFKCIEDEAPKEP